MASTGTGSHVRGEGFLRPYAVGAAVLLGFAVLCLLLQLQSPSLILWTGDPVQGTNEGGLAYYRVGDDERTLNVRGEPPAEPVPVTVWTDPDDSSHDRLESVPARCLDAALVLLPVVAAGAVLGLGLARRRGRRRRA